MALQNKLANIKGKKFLFVRHAVSEANEADYEKDRKIDAYRDPSLKDARLSSEGIV